MTNGEGASSLLLTIELPALNARTNLNFGVKPGRQEHILDTVEDLVQGLLTDSEDFVNVDTDCTEHKLDLLRKHAASENEEWQSKLRTAEEWKRKVANAGEKMNKMRNEYWKELLHWKEQVYQKQQASQKGDSSWQPSYAMHFDPSEYHMDDEVTRLVHDKVQLIEQEYQAKTAELEVGLKARVRSLNESLIVTKMKLYRKDKMMDLIMSRHGYKDEKDVKDQLGSIKEASMEKIADSIERKAERAEKQAHKELIKRKTEEFSKTNEEPAQDLKECFQSFLIRKFGSLKEAKVHVGLSRTLDERIGLADFKEFANSLGFGADPKQTFIDLSQGSPFIALRAVFDESQTGERRRHSACAPAGRPTDLLSDSFGDTVKEVLKVRRNSLANAVFRSIQESDANELQNADASDSQSSSESSSAMSSYSRTTTGTKASKVRAGQRKNSKRGPASVFSVRQKESRNQTTSETMTIVSFDSGSKAAFAAGSGMQLHFLSATSAADAATDPMPFAEAYRKIKLTDQACQSDIDAHLLDKAAECLNEAAEDDWQALMDGSLGRQESNDSNASQTPKADRHDVAAAASSGGSKSPPSSPSKGFKKSYTGLLKKNFFSSPCRPTLNRGHTTDASIADCHSPCSADKEEKQSGRESAAAVLVSPRLMRRKSAPLPNEEGNSWGTSPKLLQKPGVELQKPGIEKEVQCCLEAHLPCPSSLEDCLPQESDPLEAKIQQLDNVTGAIEKSLPLMLAHIEKLCNESGSDAAKNLLARFVKSLSVGGDQQASKDNGRPSHCYASNSVEDVLQRHGIPVESSSDPLEGRRTFTGDSRGQTNCMKGLVGEASRMSFGSGTSPRRASFTQQRRKSFEKLTKEIVSPMPKEEHEAVSVSEDSAINDMFNIKPKIQVAPRRISLSDGSQAIAEKLKKRQSPGDKADEGSELLRELTGRATAQSLQSGCSPEGTMNSTASTGPRMSSFSLSVATETRNTFTTDVGLERSSMRARGTCNTEVGNRSSMNSPRDPFSDCDSVADHLDDAMLAEFTSDRHPAHAQNMEFLREVASTRGSSISGGAKKVGLVHLHGFKLSDHEPAARSALSPGHTAPSPFDDTEALARSVDAGVENATPVSDEPAKLPSIPKRRLSSSDNSPQDTSTQSCQTLSLAEEAGTALRVCERPCEPPKRRQSLLKTQKLTGIGNEERKSSPRVFQRRNSCPLEEATSSSSTAASPSDVQVRRNSVGGSLSPSLRTKSMSSSNAAGSSDSPASRNSAGGSLSPGMRQRAIAIVGQGQSQQAAAVPIQQPAEPPPVQARPGTSRINHRRYSTN